MYLGISKILAALVLVLLVLGIAALLRRR